MRRLLVDETLRPSGLMSGCAIINARGVPGTIGFLAMTRHDRRIVMVTSHHVLFGAGAREREAVWLADDSRGVEQVARAAHGRAGIVRVETSDAWVDCGAADIDTALLSAGRAVDADAIGTARPLVAGALVTKIGAATGKTEGVVVDADHTDRVVRDAREIAAPGQILVTPARRHRAFCAEGDSGAALRDEEGAIVGLIWGVTARGEGVACPIAHVMDVLHLRALPRERGHTARPLARQTP